MNIGTRIFRKGEVLSVVDMDFGSFVLTELDLNFVEAGKQDGLTCEEIFADFHRFETYEDALASVSA